MKNNLCSSKSVKIKNIHCCDYQSKTKAILMPKKGMAEKAFKKYAENGRIDMIQKQINKGTVLIRYID